MCKLKLENYDENGFAVNITFVHDDKDIEMSFSIKDKNDLVEHLNTSCTPGGITENLFESIEYTDMLLSINKVIDYLKDELDIKNNKED